MTTEEGKLKGNSEKIVTSSWYHRGRKRSLVHVLVQHQQVVPSNREPALGMTAEHNKQGAQRKGGPCGHCRHKS